MSLTLKIKTATKTKAILFASHLSIAECQMIIQEKMETEGGGDHALFQRTPITRWLEQNKTLAFYDLVQNDELEYIKKHRPTRVKFIDGSMKTVLVDWSKSVGDILEEMGKTMHVSIPEEFGLQIEGKEGSWLQATKGLYEQGVNDDNIFLFRQHYYYHKIDEEDAFTIHVAYLQCVQDVISGFHDCTQEEAVGFAALQTQVKLGNYDPSKMLSKLDIKECLPPNFHKVKKIDEKIVREHKKLTGMTEATAKFRYYQLCRSLKTYGFLFFPVRLAVKNSKKEKPFLMGISANIISFCTVETRQVLRELTFRRLKNWSTAHGFLRLETAEDVEEEYKNVYADDLKEIADYMKGYVNIYLKRKKDKTQYGESNDENVAEITSVAAVSSNAITSFGYSGYGTMAGAYGQTFNQGSIGAPQQFSRYGTMANKANPTNLSSAMTHIGSLLEDMRNTMGQPIQRNASLTPAQWKKQLLNDTTNISGFVAKMTAALPPNQFNRSALDQKAGEIAMSLTQLIAAAKNASLKNTGETDVNLLDAVKVLADSIKELLSSARDLADSPNDPKLIERYQAAQKAFSAAVMLLQSSCKDNAMDDSSIDLLHEAAKNISLVMKDLLGVAPARPTGTEKKPIQANIAFNNATEASKLRVDELQQISTILAPAMFDMNARNQLNLSVKAVEAALLALKNAANEQEGSDLSNAIKEVMGALSYLLSSSNAGELADTLPQFSTASNALYDELAKLMSISNDPYQVASISKQISNFSSQVVNVAQKMVPLVDDTTKEQLQEAVKRLAAATTKFIKVAGTVSTNMEDEDAKRDMHEAARRIGDALRVLIGDVVERSALKLFRGDVRTAIATTVGLINAARIASASCSDPNMADQLKKSAKSAMVLAETITKSLENATKNSNDAELQRKLITEAAPFIEGAVKLQHDSTAALPHIHPKESGENNEKELLDKSIKMNEQALFKLKEAGKFAIISITQAQIDEAVERFGAEEANLVATLIDIENNSYQRKPPTVAAEAMRGLQETSKQVTAAIRSVAMTAQKSPEELGLHSKLIADSICQMNTHSRDLAYSSDNRVVQTGVVGAAQDLTIEARNMLTAARAAASHTDTPAYSQLLAGSAKRLAQALVTLVSASKGTQTLGHDCDEAVAAIAAAVQTLQIQTGGNPKDFPVLAEELERNVREVKVTSNALYAAFKTKTKTVSAAIRTAATSVTSMIKSTNAALASSSDPATQQSLIMAVYEIANAVATLVQTMKNALMQDDTQANESVAQASRDILPAIDRLMSALNDTPVLKQFQQALDSINQSVTYLTQPLNEVKSEKAASVNSNIGKLKTGTAQLAESAKGLMETSKKDAELMGDQAFAAADSISTVVENVVAMALGTKVSVYKEDAFTLKEAGQRLVNACHLHDPTSARPLLISSGKDVAEAVSKLIQKIRQEAQTAKDNEHTELLKKAATSLAQIAGTLGVVAKDSLAGNANAKDAADEAFHQLESTLEYLVTKDPSQQVTQKSRRLVTVANELCTAATQLVEAGRNAHKKPTDANVQTELQQSAVGLAKAIRDLTEMARAFGDLDMDDSVTKVSHAISELDSASISATVGQLEDRSGGQSPQDLEEGLVEISRRMAALIKNLVATEKDSIGVFAKTTKSLADLVPQLATVSIQRASITSDPDTQQRILGSGKEMADVVLAIANAIKSSNVDDIIKFAKEANNVNTKILTSVKSAVFALKECDEAVKMIAEFAKPLQSYDLKSQLGGSRDYANNQQELTKLAKEMVGAISGMVTSAKIKPIEVGDNAKKVANLIPVLVKNITEALAAISEPEARATLHNGARVVVVATTGLIQKAKLVAADPKNGKNNQQLSIAYKEVTESIAGLVAAIKAGATGEVKCEEAVEAITRRIGDLDSAALFAASGQLTSDNDDVDLLELQTKINDGCNLITQHLSAFVQSTENQLEMGNAALRATDAFDKVAKDARTVAAAVTALLDQQEVLMGAKNVGVSIQLLLTSGLSLNKNPDDDELREDLTEFAIRVNNTIRDLISELNTAISKGSSGVRDLEAARKTLQSLIDTFSTLSPSPINTAQDILGPAKGLVDAVVNITTLASSPKDIDKFIEATQQLTQCTSDILHRSKGTGNLMKPQEAQILVNAAANIANSACKFLEVTKAHKKKGGMDTGRQLSESNDELVRVISEIAEAVRPLPGSEEALRLFQEAEELEAKTEEQLQATAESVMRAYNTLAAEQQTQVKNRESPEGPSPSEQISEAILEAAVAMTTSTVHLVNAAATAQKELVTKNKSADRSQSIYKKDPAWAKGLIAACKEVGGATDSLTESSIGVSHGSKSPDALEASAKAVAAATAKLVFASKTKADPFSPTQKKMSDYARAIAAATKQLIEAAHYVQQNTSKEDENRPDWDAGEDSAREAEIEHQIKILKLAKELENAQKRLTDMRKVKTGKKLAPGEKVFSLQDLQKKPQDVDHAVLEQYLSDDDFKAVFKIDKKTFAQMPEQKRNAAKKIMGLL